MIKLVLTIAVVAPVMGLSYGTYGIFDLLALGINLTEDFQSIEIGSVGEVGYISIPFNLICRVPFVGDCIFCGLCNQDCIYAHNAYGGKCGPDPLLPGNYTCLCANTPEEQTDLGVSISTRGTCGCDFVPQTIIDAQDTIFKPVISTRAKVLQCAIIGITTTACYNDCRSNHGIVGGTCRVRSPKAEGSGLLPTLFCECT